MLGTFNILTAPIFDAAGMAAHFSDDALIADLIRTETALARAQARVALIPAEAARAIEQVLSNARVTPRDLALGVSASGVPIPALLSSLREGMDEEAADWLHFGTTSQDILDTALCLRYSAAFTELASALSQLVDRLQTLSLSHSSTLMLARTRGQLATPTTFGLRVAQWGQPLIRLESTADCVRAAGLKVQLGGASGSANGLGSAASAVTAHMAKDLGLAEAPPWHTDRSGLRSLTSWLGRLVAACAKIGDDVALSTRGEIRELLLKNGGASSAMPHKSNPVRAEALQSLLPLAVSAETGLATSASHAEERAGGNWSAEWALLPTLFCLAGAALFHAKLLLDNLEADEEAMRARLDATPEAYAEAITLALSEKIGRAEAAKQVASLLAGDVPLTEALPDVPGIDWSAVLEDTAFVVPAASVAARIFDRRALGANDG